jgi:hypothetical protein
MTAQNDYGPAIGIGQMAFNTYGPDVVAPEQEWYAAVVGWEACPKRIVSLPNVHSDGDQPQRMTLAARPISLRGTMKVTGPNAGQLLDAAKTRLLRATMAHPDALVLLTVSETPSTQALVHLAEDPPQWNVTACDDAGGTARFQVGLVVPGGAKYSTFPVSAPLSVGIATPQPSIAHSTTGGTLVQGIYGYRVSAVGASGETLASPTVSRGIFGLPTPGTPALSTSGVGGSLPAAGNFEYRVSAINSLGETLASASAYLWTAGPGPNTRSNTVTWSPVAGATGYRVYGRTIGTTLQRIVEVADTSWVDTGASSPSGALPTSNTTVTTSNSLTISWPPIAGATGYKVYGRTVTNERLLTPTPIAAASYVDTGSATPTSLPPATSLASVDLANDGNWSTPLVVTVDGPATNPVIIALGERRIQVDSSLSSVQQLVVDFGRRVVTINGADRRDLLNGVSEWWLLPPGTHAVDYSGGGTPSAAYRHAYA